MKFIGILRDYEHSPIKIGRFLSEFDVSDEKNINDLNEIVSYLTNGTIVIAFLHYVFDEKKNQIAPLIYYTDGKFIWPSYLPYYLKKGYYSLLTTEFMNNIRGNNYIPPKLESEKIILAQQFYNTSYSPQTK